MSSYHYLVGPLVAFGALLVIVLMCRWVFAPPPGRRTAASAPPARSTDYGLLVPVATARTADDAEMLRGVLTDAGIRCTVAGTSLLVFRADATRAQALVSS